MFRMTNLNSLVSTHSVTVSVVPAVCQEGALLHHFTFFGSPFAVCALCNMNPLV